MDKVRRILYFISIVFVFVATVLTMIATVIHSDVAPVIWQETEALTYSNEGPGSQGQRHSQAVWCGGGGWTIRVGCCYGSENCSIYDCPTNTFSCDGNTWLQL